MMLHTEHTTLSDILTWLDTEEPASTDCFDLEHYCAGTFFLQRKKVRGKTAGGGGRRGSAE